MGRLYDLVQQHIDRQSYPPSNSKVAEQLGVPRQTLTNWKAPRELPDKAALVRLADLVGVPYEVVRDAVLEDIGYLRRDQKVKSRRQRLVEAQAAEDQIAPKVADVLEARSKRERMQEVQQRAAESDPPLD